MIIILLSIVAIVAFSFIGWRCNKDYSRKMKREGALFGASVSGVCLGGLLAVVLFISYDSYLDISKIKGTVEQYATTIETYSNRGVKDFKTANPALTDMKYNSYQEQIGEMIDNLRYQIVRHNKIVIGKRMMESNIFFNWLVISPDEDVKLLTMEDYI